MSAPTPWPAFQVPDPLPADGTVLHERDGWRWVWDEPGERVACERVPGGVADVEDRILTALHAAVTQLEQAYADWPTMTNAQKDTAMRGTIRVAAKLCRLAARDLQNEGV